MSIVITFQSAGGFDGSTLTDVTSEYERIPATDDRNGYSGNTGPAGTGVDPIGIVRPRFAAEAIEDQLKTGDVPLRLIRTSAQLEPVNAVTIDDFIAWSVQVKSADPIPDLVVEVYNVFTGMAVDTVTMVDLAAGLLFVSSECRLVPTMHALRFTGTAAELQVTLVFEPVDNPREFATLCAARAIEASGAVVVPASGALLTFGNNSILATTADRLLSPWYSDTQADTTDATRPTIVAPYDATVDRLYVDHGNPAGNGEDIVYTFRVNEAGSVLTATLASTGTQASDLVNTVDVDQGDELDFEATKALSIGSSPSNIVASMRIRPR